MMWAMLASGVVVLVVLLLLIHWYAQSRYERGRAEVINAMHAEAARRRRVADELQAKSVADESAWVERMRRRLQARRDSGD